MVAGFTIAVAAVLVLANYVLFGLAYMKLTKKRGMKHRFLAWIPFLKIYLMGKVQDDINAQYNQKTHRGAILLLLSVASLILSGVTTATFMATSFSDQVLSILQSGGTVDQATMDQMMNSVSSGEAFSFIIWGLLLAILGIAILVLQYMALYSVFKEYAVSSAGIYLVVTLLCELFLKVAFIGPILILYIYKNQPQFEVLNTRKAYQAEEPFPFNRK